MSQALIPILLIIIMLWEIMIFSIELRKNFLRAQKKSFEREFKLEF